MRGWLEECEQSHPDCGLPGEGVVNLPSRVLDVGPSDGSFQPRLFVSSHQRAPYAALSHCWGTAQTIKTTTSSLQERLNEIALDSLPKTFRDAVLITRALNLRYL